MASLTLDLRLSAQSDLDWYNASSLKTMLRWRSDRWRDVKSKSEVVALLRTCLFEPGSIRAALASLDVIGREALVLLKRKGGAMPVAAMSGQVAVWHPNLTPQQIRGTPAELVRRALAFWHTPASHYGRPMVHDVQRPAVDNVHAAMIFSAPEILEHVVVPANLGEAYLTPLGSAEIATLPAQWQRQVLSFLRAVETRGPRILQSGVISSRDRDALARVIDLGDDVPGAPRLSAVNFYRTTLMAAGLFEISGDRQLRTSAATRGFVSQPPARQAQMLLNAWISAGENELTALGHLHCERHANAPKVTPHPERVNQAHQALVDLLREQVRPGHWYDLAHVSDAMRQQDVEFLVSWLDPVPYRWNSYEYSFNRDRLKFPPYPGVTLEDSRGRSRNLIMGEDWDLVEGAFIRAVFRGPLTWLGLVECQIDADGRELFAITPLGAQALELEGSAPSPGPEEIASNADALVVQPNFDVVVYSPTEHTELLYHIDRFAERISVDRLAIYRLTNESICSGLQLGLHIDDVIGLLEGASRSSLPQNVTFTLRDWARRFEAVHWIRNAWLLESPDAAALDRWLADPEIARAVDRRISPTIALCTGRRPADLPNLLASAMADVAIVDANAPLKPCGRVDGFTTISIPPRDASFYLRRALDAIAELISEDERSCRYRISPASIARAIHDGKTAEQIVDLLAQIVFGPVPGGMCLRVRGWSGDFGSVALGQVGLLVAPDAESFRELRADPGVAAGFIQSISATAAIVDLSHLDTLRRALDERGISTSAYESPLAPRPAGPALPTRPNGADCPP